MVQAITSTSPTPTPSFGVEDVVDIINPLQHIPFVSNLYREASGDTIGAGSRILGGAVFGGPIGFLAGLANVIFEQATGKDAGNALVASLTGEDTGAATPAERTVNLGDFAGDVKRMIRTYRFESETGEASAKLSA